MEVFLSVKYTGRDTKEYCLYKLEAGEWTRVMGISLNTLNFFWVRTLSPRMSVKRDFWLIILMFYCLSIRFASPSILFKANNFCFFKKYLLIINVQSDTSISNVCSAPVWVGKGEKCASVPHYLLPSSLLPPSLLFSSLLPSTRCVSWEKYYKRVAEGKTTGLCLHEGLFQTDQCRVIYVLHPSLKGTWDRSMSENWKEVGWECSSVLSGFSSLLVCPWPGQVWGMGPVPGRLGLWAPVPSSQQTVPCWLSCVVDYLKMSTVWCVMFLPKPVDSWNHCFLFWKAALSHFVGHLLSLLQMNHS